MYDCIVKVAKGNNIKIRGEIFSQNYNVCEKEK